MDILPSLRPGALTVVQAPQAAAEVFSALAARLALRGPLTVLDGGNRFQPYRVARLLRERTAQVSAAAGRLFVRRAFTCYQMTALLEATLALPQPYLVLDLLACFHDEQVPPGEAARLLDLCLRQLRRLGARAPVAVSLSPAPAAGRDFLVARVCAQADCLFLPPPPPAGPQQPGLW